MGRHWLSNCAWFDFKRSPLNDKSTWKMHKETAREDRPTERERHKERKREGNEIVLSLASTICVCVWLWVALIEADWMNEWLAIILREWIFDTNIAFCFNYLPNISCIFFNLLFKSGTVIIISYIVKITW